MSHALQALLEGMAVIVGEENCLTGPDIRNSFAVDGTVPQCVLAPRSENETARVLRRAADHGLAVIPCCNATKLATGGAPRRYDIALSLVNMRGVKNFEPGDLTLSAGPGVELGWLQQFLAPHGLWAPFDPPGGSRTSLGGLVATNASGPLRLRYGAPRDAVLGMRIATTNEKIIKTGGQVVKNVAGYDLARLLTGSYGTLGVIVEISLKLFPLPFARATWRINTSHLQAAHDFRRSLLLSALSPARMVLLDPGAAALARGQDLENAPGDQEYEVRVEFFASEKVLKRCEQTTGEIASASGLKAAPVEQPEAMASWDRIADTAALLAAHYPHLIALKITLPIASSEAFTQLIAAEAKKLGVRCACVCQNGAGVIRANLLPTTADTGISESLEHGIISTLLHLRAQASERGGALVIERCPLDIKKHIDVWGPAGSDFALMHKLKELWDAKGTLSPGRFIGGL